MRIPTYEEALAKLTKVTNGPRRTHHRRAPGMKDGRAKLSDIQREQLLFLWDLGYRQTDLAAAYGVTQGTISRVTRPRGGR